MSNISTLRYDVRQQVEPEHYYQPYEEPDVVESDGDWNVQLSSLGTTLVIAFRVLQKQEKNI